MQGKLTTDCDGSVEHKKWQEPVGTLLMALTAYTWTQSFMSGKHIQNHTENSSGQNNSQRPKQLMSSKFRSTSIMPPCVLKVPLLSHWKEQSLWHQHRVKLWSTISDWKVSTWIPNSTHKPHLQRWQASFQSLDCAHAKMGSPLFGNPRISQSMPTHPMMSETCMLLAQKGNKW